MLLVIICSLVGGIISLLGGIFLITRPKFTRYLEYLTAFAGGSLLAAAFVDLLPEALHSSTDLPLTIYSVLFGLLFFFVLELILTKFCGHGHCQHSHHDHQPQTTDPLVPMLIIGDTIHNFVDGIAIAGGFLISPLSGLIVTIAVAAHEIPQEMGEFALLFKKNYPRRKIVLSNLLSSLATVIGAVIFYALGQTTNLPLGPLLGLVAGFFIYLAVSDIIPGINQKKNFALRARKTATLIIGVILTSLIITTLHGVAHTHQEPVENSPTSEINHEHHDHQHEPHVH